LPPILFQELLLTLSDPTPSFNFTQREEHDYDDDDEQERPRTLFCGQGLGALCAAIHHLHPYETATAAAAKRKEYRQRQQQAAKNERGIPSSETNERATGAGEVAVEEGVEEEVEIDMHASASRPQQQQQQQQQQQPMSRSQQQGHDDVYSAAGNNSRGTRSFYTSSIPLPFLPTTTPLTDMLATLRGTRPPAAAAAAAADAAADTTNPIPQLTPMRQLEPNPNQRRRLHAIPASLKAHKFVQCMSCREEEWLQVPQTAKYVRCPTCSSITIALASNTRFPAGEGVRAGGSPCTRLMALLSVLGRGGGGPASL